MEMEKFVSGYCRQLDTARTVCVVLEGGEITDIDCCYANCTYRPGCPIAKEVDALTEN